VSDGTTDGTATKKPRRRVDHSVPEESPGWWREERLRQQEVRAQEEKKGWYGAPIVALDLSAVAMAIGGGLLHSNTGDAIAYTGVGVYAFGGPAVHLYQGYPLRGLFDLGMRALVPSGLFILLLYPTSDLGVGVLAAGTGIIGACVVDYAYLAFHDAPAPTSTSRYNLPVAVYPHVGMVQDSARVRIPAFGVGGQF
jgi:hypothetical protein